MSQAAAAEFIPLDADAQGVLRVAGTGVTLDAVIEVYQSGHPPEEIVQRYPSLQLADVYAVLTYYLRHQGEVGAYLRRRKAEVTLLAGERSELLARKHGGKDLSAGEQKHLEELTTKLKELLPPVSSRDLEALLEMTEDVMRIRARAGERRRRLGSQ